MNCGSGGASENLLIQQKETVLSIEYIIPELFYPCSCDDEWYFGVTTFFENSQSIKESISFIESRFSNCSTFKGTSKNHEFIPGGENTVLNCGSGSTSENLLIQKKETVLSIEYIIPEFFYPCSCDDEWYFGVANYVLVENCDVNIKFLKVQMVLLPSSLGIVLRTVTGS